MPYYKGERVPECFARWDGGDPECQVCQVEAMCLDVQDEKTNAPSVSSSYRPVKSKPTSTNQSLATLPGREDVMPREGEHWATRLGKNMACGALSAAGTEVAVFFKYFRF